MGKKTKKKPTKVSKKSTSKQKKVLFQKPQWQYCFKTQKYIMNEIKNGIQYSVELNKSQWERMMSECINTLERGQWLSKNKKEPRRVAV